MCRNHYVTFTFLSKWLHVLQETCGKSWLQIMFQLLNAISFYFRIWLLKLLIILHLWIYASFTCLLLLWFCQTFNHLLWYNNHFFKTLNHCNSLETEKNLLGCKLMTSFEFQLTKVANLLVWGFVLNEFELVLQYYVSFKTNTLLTGINRLVPRAISWIISRVLLLRENPWF